MSVSGVQILAPESIEARVDALDTTLYDPIPSQTSAADRSSLLTVQNAIVSRLGAYTYLEIGSHLGGSIQPHLLDPRCRKIYSIDKRPDHAPDQRGKTVGYEGVSTELMMQRLGALFARAPDKITTFDADVSTLSAAAIADPPDLCFVDGEHTNEAALRDSLFCLSVAAKRSAICFHDSEIVFGGISEFIDRLRASGQPFNAYNLPSTVFVVELGGLDIHVEPQVLSLLANNYVWYLEGLKGLAPYARMLGLLR
jgi:hypothetical protein